MIFWWCALGDFGSGGWWWPGGLAGCAGFHGPGAGWSMKWVMVGSGQAALSSGVVPQTCTRAGAVRVVMAREAVVNAWRVLVLWWRWRWRSVVTRVVAIVSRAAWWAADLAAVGRPAVVVPVRTVGDEGAAGGGERQVPGLDGLPGAGALVEGVREGGGRAGGGVDQFGGHDPGGVLLSDQVWGVGA